MLTGLPKNKMQFTPMKYDIASINITKTPVKNKNNTCMRYRESLTLLCLLR